MNEHVNRLPPIRFDCGTDDSLFSGAEILHHAMVNRNIAHSFDRFSGGHEWSYWHNQVHRSFLFFENILR
jgi:putative tributyrin esterase